MANEKMPDDWAERAEHCFKCDRHESKCICPTPDLTEGDAIKGPVLASCPFCGGEPKLTKVVSGYTHVYCTPCDVVLADDIEAEAIRRWNTRARSADREALDVMRKALILIEQGATSEMASKRAATALFKADNILSAAHQEDRDDGK